MPKNDQSPYLAEPGSPLPRVRSESVPWGRLLVRTFLITVPGQILGILIGGWVVELSGQLTENPGLANLITIVSGVVAGIGLGLLLTPSRRHRRAYVVASVVLGAAVDLALLIIAQLGHPNGTVSIQFSGVLLGPVLVAAVQSAVAFGLWWAKGRDD